MSDSRKRFEEWAKGADVGLPGSFMHQSARKAWSARDSEVERLREALKEAQLALVEACGFPPHAINVQVAKAAHNARRALSSQDKESA